MKTHRHALQVGTKLFEYEIIKMIGSGGFGIVYLAKDIELDQEIVIKEYLPNEFAIREVDQTVLAKTIKDEKEFNWGLEKFLEEARILATFRDHPNIVSVLRYFRANKTAYIVMEYAGSTSLKDYLDKHKTLTEEQIDAIIYPLFDALGTVHEGGLIHRDLKPGNILINNKGEPVLIDFGAARHAIGSKSLSITAIITAGYSPFEQYTSKTEQGPWTDIYSLSAVLYRCVTGNKPSDATDRIADDDAIILTEHQEFKNNYSKCLLNFIDHGLRVHAENRPQSIYEWLKLLKAPRENPDIHQGKDITGNQSQKRRKSIAVPLLSLSIIVSISYFFYVYFNNMLTSNITEVKQQQTEENTTSKDKNIESNTVLSPPFSSSKSDFVLNNPPSGSDHKKIQNNDAIDRSSRPKEERISHVISRDTDLSNNNIDTKLKENDNSLNKVSLNDKNKKFTIVPTPNKIMKTPKNSSMESISDYKKVSLKKEKERAKAKRIKKIEILVKSLSALMGDISRRVKEENLYRKQNVTFKKLIKISGSKQRIKEYRESLLNIKRRHDKSLSEKEEAKDVYLNYLKELCGYDSVDITNTIKGMKSEDMMFSSRFNKINKHRKDICGKNIAYEKLKKIIF